MIALLFSPPLAGKTFLCRLAAGTAQTAAQNYKLLLLKARGPAQAAQTPQSLLFFA
jgi:hypothetical protein